MFEAIVALVVASTLLLGSPGPVPMALAAIGAVFGFRAGIPFLLGILAGFAVAISVGSAGLALLFESFPAARVAVKIAGGLFICYVAFKIATAPVLSRQESHSEAVPSLKDGFVLNLLNPKAYAVFMALFSQFLLPFSSGALGAIATALVVFGIAAIVDTAWLAAGGLLRPVFESPRFARPARISFGVLMLIAVGAVLFAP